MTQDPEAESLRAQRAEHVATLNARWTEALARFDYDGAWLGAGGETFYFQDDQGPRFKPNPYLCQWLDPQFVSAEAKLLLRRDARPQLFLVQPEDYWHASAPLPDHMQTHLDIRTFPDAAAQLAACQAAVSAEETLAHIGPAVADNELMGELNPPALLDHLHFGRAVKTGYEIAAMRIASDVGARGHLAAEQAFHAGGSEFEVHLAYLAASQQNEAALPYGNIVAINEHASVLHYQFQERTRPDITRSLLIDAGGEYRGFASDITRTYATADGDHDEFAALIGAMQTHQDSLIAGVRAGRTFADLHVQMHQQLAEVLATAGLVTCSAEAAFADGLTTCFCPHGLGHLLGLQVHDVGGHLADADGNQAPPPEQYPTLRFTRAMAIDQVFTIEPGLYFIPMLLERERSKGAAINWEAVARLTPYGGIRIEDNVRVLEGGVENLTRDAFARVADER